ncbi:MAG TPA: MmcQ/YjbR family DNA-binding protein [Gemmatimonadales bacterium]|nr:MmcQ/YjbR family DNA-binding protein [Gemmatimonadales bacterium]
MTTKAFRRTALSLPEAHEGVHMGHPDFRVGGKVFATLAWPDAAWGMVKLSPEQQEQFVRAAPAAFRPVAGAWGRRGCTQVRLRAAQTAVVRGALLAAWLNAAPRRLARAAFAGSLPHRAARGSATS